MRNLNRGDKLRKAVLQLSHLDWALVNLTDNTVELGDILVDYLELGKSIFTYDEILDLLSEDSKSALEKTLPLLSNGITKSVNLTLCEDKYPNTGIYIDISEINDTYNTILGYIHVVDSSYIKYGVRGAVADAVMKERESNKQKNAFLADVSHELRTPINAIVGFSKILATTDNQDEKEEYVHIIEENNAALLQLINDILDLTKIESGTLDFRYATFDLNQLMKDIYKSAFLRQNNDNVKMLFEDCIEQITITTDKSRLMQVLNNIINNALKFTSQGSITIGYKIADDKIRFYVKDTGVGISEEHIAHIFDRYMRLNSNVNGNGLGLCISSSIVRSLGGKMGVESQLGEGSTFWVELANDYIPEEEEEVAIPVAKNENPENTGEKRVKVLIAEDDKSNYKLCEVLLKNKFDLIHAWNGVEAVKLYNEYHPDVVLMDLNMPEMDGYEATELIRRISWNTPIIAVTAYALANDEQKVMNSGFDAYLTKPLDVSKLIRTINGSRHKEE